MDITTNYNLLPDIMTSVSNTIENMSPIVAIILGIVLALVIIELIIDLFSEHEPTITVGGMTLTQADINNNEKMPLDWYHSLTYEQQKSIADFDHEQARLKMDIH